MKVRFGQVNGAAAFGDIARARLTRRGFLGAGLALATAAPPWHTAAATSAGSPAFDFEPIGHGIDERHHVAPGYDARVLMRWATA